MLRALGLKRSEPSLSEAAAAPMVLQLAHDFEVSLQAMDFLLDDRTEEGLHLINDDPDSTIKTLASGVIHFLEATLGFEPEVMRKAGEILSKAEQLSTRDRAKHQKIKLKTSANFPPGTVYAVTYAEATLLHALIMLMSESMIESAKALLKLRKAYQILDEVRTQIKANEKKRKLDAARSGSPRAYESGASSGSSFVSAMDASSSAGPTHSSDIPFTMSQEILSDRSVTDLADKVQCMRMSRLEGSHIGNTPATERLRSTVGYQQSSTEAMAKEKTPEPSTTPSLESSQGTIEEFIVSGTNLCFGILQLVISLIPPAVGKVLSVFGMSANKEDALRMIWKSVQGRNVHGSIGLLALLVFYDGPFQFTDADFDIPDPLSTTFSREATFDEDNDDTELALKKMRSKKIMDAESQAYQGTGAPTLLHPGKKLEDALLYARALFPNSALWLLQEARMLASRGRLEESLGLLDSLKRPIRMRQVEALLRFDRVMILTFMHNYERAAAEFLKLIEINAWSPALYGYAAGSCYLELYRMCRLGLITDPEQLKREAEFKKKAEELIIKAPIYAKQKTKLMPFDKFVLRKTAQFEANAKKNNCSLVDAIGVSPTHELMYFWNGYNRMYEDNLVTSQKLLSYSISEKAVCAETANQTMVRQFLTALTLRRLGQAEEGIKILDEELIPKIITFQPGNKKEPYKYKHLTEDPWLYPTVFYERALFEWKVNGVDGLTKARQWLKYGQDYSDDYELSTRVAMKIKAASDRLDSL
ncbi:CYFA0S30e00936g1_1 [Cyberlindnera fabianii]|uniref:CYFA0S30e00936g1_1 n=1 Tax=Cyberlindnera fabianii TaxID=36022 RepID=A0A061BBC1_CYBFA|nr:CYFA0S30e00936g1_1 [Cyberlindnera fabianii]